MLIFGQNIQKQKFFIETDVPLSVTWLMCQNIIFILPPENLNI